jgi:hypothetical protein
MKSFKTFITEKVDQKDSITLDIPLLIRVLELAREDVKTDMELHRVVERLINIRNKGVLTMDEYDFIAGLKKKLGEDILHEVAAWQRSAGKDPKGGLNRKGIASYRREHPGSKLSMAVTTPPSKLKKGSKAANRRKSFCARMSGMKAKLTSSKTANDPDSRINKSLRKWNC